MWQVLRDVLCCTASCVRACGPEGLGIAAGWGGREGGHTCQGKINSTEGQPARYILSRHTRHALPHSFIHSLKHSLNNEPLCLPQLYKQ